MGERFLWHPDARLAGAEAAALQRVLASDAPFRIGLPNAPAPLPGAVPVFETLTSGSTGVPRRIRRSHASWTASFAVNAGMFGIGPGVRVAVLGGLEQSLALYGALEGVHLGATVQLLGGVRPDRQVAALAAVDVVYATPAQLRALRGGPLDVRLILVGGSKLDARLRADLAELCPAAEVREFYGAAEASFISLADAETPEGSVGRPYPGGSVEVRDGEVWVKSPYLFMGYASDPGSARWDNGWLSVGEMGRLEGGFLYLRGRKGRMVTVADHNVFPEEIEALMEAMPGVLRAAVLAEPDAARGQVLYAVAMGDPGAEAAVLAALRGVLGPLKAPRRIVWRDAWPVTASGKTDLAALEGGG